MLKKNTIAMVLFCILIGCSIGDDGKSTDDAKIKSQKNDSSKKYEPFTEGLLSPDNILNIAHRGASGHAPEHTLTSYETGEDMHADYIEIDLQMTEDGELIAMHDDDVARTTLADGSVDDFTLEEITSLDAGSWFNDEYSDVAESEFEEEQVPSLEEILDTFGEDVNYYIETKNPDESPEMVDELIDMLNEHHLLDDDISDSQVIIQSFSADSLQETHEIESSIPLIQLISYEEEARISSGELEEIAKYAIGIGANYEHLTEKYIQEVRDADLLMHPYTVNETADMRQLMDWGATGFFTNYPDRLHDVLKELDQEKE